MLKICAVRDISQLRTLTNYATPRQNRNLSFNLYEIKSRAAAFFGRIN